MHVALVAHTALTNANALDLDWAATRGLGTSDADFLVEGSGRACYQAWNRPNPATRETADYLANIIKQGHFSVMEHASASFYVTGVSRSLTHELVRHRHLSFSQLSQRFVNEEGAEYVVPPAMASLPSHQSLDYAFERALEVYEYLVATLLSEGCTRKQAREAARAVLPNMTETKLVVTGNFRAWRDVIARRIDPSADAEIQELARKVLAELKELAPGCFQDLEVPE